MNRNLIVPLIAIAALIIGGISLVQPNEKTIVERVIERVGAFPGPDINSDYLSFNGVKHWYYSSKLRTATTTVCSFKSPAATTTVSMAGIRFNTSSTTASYVYIGKGANNNATTTLLGQAPLTANQKGTIIATTTPLDGLDEDKVISPSQYINFGMNPTEANSKGTFSPVGGCVLELIEI